MDFQKSGSTQGCQLVWSMTYDEWCSKLFTPTFHFWNGWWGVNINPYKTKFVQNLSSVHLKQFFYKPVRPFPFPKHHPSWICLKDIQVLVFLQLQNQSVSTSDLVQFNGGLWPLQMIIFLELVTNYRPDEMCIAQDPLDKNWLIAIGRGAQQVVPQLVGYVHLNESLFVLRHEFRHTRPLLCHFTGLGSWLFKQILVSQHEGPSLKVPVGYSAKDDISLPLLTVKCVFMFLKVFICKRECVGFGTQLMCNYLVSIQSLTVKTKLPT